MARVHRSLRRRIRRPVRGRGHLLLPRGDLHRDLHLRVEAPPGVGALLDRRADRDRRARRRILRGRGERVDEPAAGLHARFRRQRHRRRSAQGGVQPRGAVRGSAHDPGGLPGHRFPRRVGVRGGDAARAARPPPSPRPPDPAHGRGDRDADPVRGGRHRGARDRQGPADQVRRDGVRAGDALRCDGVHLRALHVGRSEGRHRHPGLRLVPGGLEHRHRGDRAEHRPARRPAAREHDAALGVRHDGRDLYRADPAGALARVELAA